MLEKDTQRTPEESRVVYNDLRYYTIAFEDKLVYYPSVTTILNVFPKEFIHEWREAVGKDVANATTNQALAKGSRVHNALEELIQGKKIICNPYGMKYFSDEEIQSFRKYNNTHELTSPVEYMEVLKVVQFLEKTNARNLFSEKKVYSVIHEFAGTADLIFYIPKSGEYSISGKVPVWLEEGWWLGDYKTGKNVSDTAKYQMASYLVALEEMYSIKLQGAMVLHTNAKTQTGIKGFKAHVFDRKKMLELFEDFKVIQKMFLLSNPNPTPKDLEFQKETSFKVKYDKHVKEIFG